MTRTKKHHNKHHKKHHKKTIHHKTARRHPSNLLILPNRTPTNIDEISNEINPRNLKDIAVQDRLTT
jgi:hypothetical protein